MSLDLRCALVGFPDGLAQQDTIEGGSKTQQISLTQTHGKIINYRRYSNKEERGAVVDSYIRAIDSSH
jgi:hypothetical protein